MNCPVCARVTCAVSVGTSPLSDYICSTIRESDRQPVFNHDLNNVQIAT